MSITNNFITIDNEPLRPAPKFNISYEPFKAGEYIIGGLTKLAITGEIYASSDQDLIDKIEKISGYSATCRSIFISCNGQTLINGNGFIKSVTLNANDQPFTVNYTLDIEISNYSGGLAVVRDSAFTSLIDVTIPSHINLKSYEENLSLVGDDTLSNSTFYVNKYYTKAQLKLSGQISIQAHHHMCENDNTLIDDLHTILNNRFIKILTLTSNLSIAYPAIAAYCNNNYDAIHDNKTFTVNKFENKVSIQFDMYIVPKLPNNAYPSAIVDLSIVENKDQLTGFNTLNVRGNIKGLGDRSSNSLDNKVLLSEKLNNARTTYAAIIQQLDNREYDDIIVSGCYNGISTLPSDVCYNRISSQITENLHGGQIDFEISYGDLQSCQLGSNNIEVSITEDFPTLSYIEHIVPGRGYPVIQIGYNYTPMKISLTVSGKLNGCDLFNTTVNNIGQAIEIRPTINNGIEYITNPGVFNPGALLPILIGCVETRLTEEINDRGYGSYFLVNENKTLGKYSYKIVRNYIGFFPVIY